MDAVGAWERGDAVPRLKSFYALQEVLGCTADDLLADDAPSASSEPQKGSR